ncbi:hypothetical protein LEP1GSC043_3882 [Leptospira weilii str. Ecochallenge]|uniref:Uncharacterized protein n=1 Tax=Leptospira weilii str. Ecochallenge TaxID=1049986 RepID=N1U0H3_9LEPT|nr:hypothetical protein LEP1GSC043_3882 [Leptospira weilii str. Ecochallenge]
MKNPYDFCEWKGKTNFTPKIESEFGESFSRTDRFLVSRSIVAML